jgi:hypothetical protein
LETLYGARGYRVRHVRIADRTHRPDVHLRFTAPPTAPELQVIVKPATTVALVHPSPDVDHPDAGVDVRGQRAPAVPEVPWVWV